MRGLQFLAIDLSNKCNLKCSMCSKFSAYTDFEMTSGDLDAFCRLCADTPAPFIRVGGGEALLHPQFRAFLGAIMDLGKPIELATNGLLLPRHEWVFAEPRVKVVHISVYKGTNDWIVDRYKDQAKVNLIKYRKWFQTFYDPNYSLAEAQDAYNHCACTMATVCGRKVYGCGTAEPLERMKKLGPLHVFLREGWMQDFEAFDTLKACQHCWLPSGAKTDAIGPTKEKGETTFDHEGVFC